MQGAISVTCIVRRERQRRRRVCNRRSEVAGSWRQTVDQPAPRCQGAICRLLNARGSRFCAPAIAGSGITRRLGCSASDMAKVRIGRGC